MRSLIFSLFILLIVSGCSNLGYYLHSAKGHFAIMQKTQPISELIIDPETPEPLVKKLNLVLKIKNFAEQNLKLPKSDSYTVYADLERNYVIKNLVATEQFSINPIEWCYPFVGCASYRGYFEEDRLAEYKQTLERQGKDIYVGRVNAYSTLGWFSDPVLNTFINKVDYKLAGLIFHELAHQKLYISGDSAFNESFASAVQQAGTELWLQQKGDQEQLSQYRQYLINRIKVTGLISQGRQSLQTLYTSTKDLNALKVGKNRIIKSMQQDYLTLSSTFKVADGYHYWFSKDLNNAKLASVATYHTLVPAFKNLLTYYDYNFEAFYKNVKQISELPEDSRKKCLEMLMDINLIKGNEVCGLS